MSDTMFLDLQKEMTTNIDFINKVERIIHAINLADKCKPKAIVIAMEELRHYKQIAKTAFTVSPTYTPLIYNVKM